MAVVSLVRNGCPAHRIVVNATLPLPENRLPVSRPHGQVAAQMSLHPAKVKQKRRFHIR
jgi:hypothetical protein